MIVKYITYTFQVLLLSFLLWSLGSGFYAYYSVYAKVSNKDLELEQLQEIRKEILLSIPEVKTGESSPLFTLYLSDTQEKEVVENLLEERKNLVKPKKREPLEEILTLEIPSIHESIKTKYRNDGNLEDINKDLRDYAVRYSPKDIQHSGVTTIFGHSSQPLLSGGDYRFFKKLPVLGLNEKVTLVGKEHKKEYKVKFSLEIETKELQEYIDQYETKGVTENKNYIILITCYPLNTTQKRWIIILEENV